ncbi:MAG: transposase [Acidobacteriota bacterium]|jgi:REP element-mobilizing transposase RayT|nr:transposase [Acidobacteriota bacterium]
MPGSFACLHYHIVFGTRNRLPLIAPDIAAPLHGYLAGIVNRLGGKAVLIGGTADHVHILARLGRDRCVADAVRDLKANSTRWIRETYPPHCAFGWQDGYGAFTISYPGVDRVVAYIRGKEEHHRVVSFREEFQSFLRRHDIEFDERCL